VTPGIRFPVGFNGRAAQKPRQPFAARENPVSTHPINAARGDQTSTGAVPAAPLTSELHARPHILTMSCNSMLIHSIRK
jgi:hypothetical protein